MSLRTLMHIMGLVLGAQLAGIVQAEDMAKTLAPESRLSCAFPFELRVVRGLDFGRIALERGRSGQVDVEADGGYRQLGGAFVSVPPTPAELQFCGPAESRFELQIDHRSDATFNGSGGSRDPQLAAGSLHVIAMGAELRRVGSTVWEGTIGRSGIVSIRIAGRLDVLSETHAQQSSARVSVSLRSR